MVLTLTGRIAAQDALLDTDLRHLGSFETDSGQFLYAATGQNGGLSVYRIDAGGQLASLADSTYYDVSGLGVGGFGIVETGAGAQLVLHGVGQGALIGYAIENDGTLAEAATMDLPGHGRQTPSAVAAFALGAGRSALYMVDAETGGIDAWIADGKGRITAEAGRDGRPADYALDPDAVLTVIGPGAATGGRAFLLAADAGTQGVSCYAIDAETGGLSRSDTLGAADGLGVAQPTALETVTAHGTTWAILAAAGSSSLSVMEVGADGTLTATDHVIDTRATRFAGVTALEVVEADGHVFVLAGGADDGLSLFALLPDGRLVHLQSLAQDAGMGLENVTGIEAVRTGDQIQIFVTAGGGDQQGGLSQFALDLDSLGAVLDGSGIAAGGALDGTGAGDVILGSGDKLVIAGEAGDDILVSGAGGAVLSGGAGADTFVLSPTDDTLRILDFERGSDRLDLSMFPMLRSLDQLRLDPTSTGTWVRFGDTEIKVVSADGKPLTAADLWPGGFDTPDRVALPPAHPAPPDPIGPTPGDDVLGGTAGNDLLRGLDGNDRLSGFAGRDRLLGGAGDDLLQGGGGRDRLAGQAGEDRLLGGAGGDRLRGGAGDDALSGQGGNDRLLAGKGTDRLLGGSGDDALTGGAGDDRLDGGTGGDLLSGQAGDDRLLGGAGDDVLSGGKGADWIEGGSGDDRLQGGGGRDRFVFGEDHGDDYIADFNPTQDQIRFEVPGLSHADLTISALDGATLIDTGEGTILLEGIDPEDLDPEHFLFT